MFFSMISSSRMIFFALPPVGSFTIRSSTEGTCTVANSSSSLLFFFLTRAAIFSVLFRMSGNGLEESTAMGVKTG